jgi:hypothetical protein
VWRLHLSSRELLDTLPGHPYYKGNNKMSFDLKITDRDGHMGELAANITTEQRQHIAEYLIRARFSSEPLSRNTGGGQAPSRVFIAQPEFVAPGCLHEPGKPMTVQPGEDGTYVKCKHCGEFYGPARIIAMGGGGAGPCK